MTIPLLTWFVGTIMPIINMRILKGNLIISSTINGVTRFRPPIGPKDVDLLKELYN